MAATVPGSRPYFSDAEFYNGNADSAYTARRLLQWANYTYWKHGGSTPFDPAAYGCNDFQGTEGDHGFQGYIGYCGLDAEGGYIPTQLGAFVVPPSHGPHTHLTVKCSVTATGSIGYIRLTSLRGAVYDLPFNNVATWLMASVPAIAGDVFVVTGHRTGGANPATIGNLHVRWTDLGALAWTPMLQAHFADGRPDNVHALRWYARMANAFAGTKAPIVANKYYGYWRNDGADADTEVGRYVLYVSPRVSQIKVQLLARLASGTGGVTLDAPALDGGGALFGQQTVTFDAGAYSWYEATIAVTPSDTPRECALVISNTAGTRVRVATVQAVESAVSLGLVGGESVQSFVSVDDTAVALGSPILTAQRSALARNMVQCWSTRGLRSLVSDCRYDGMLTDHWIIPAGTKYNTDPLYYGDPENRLGSNQMMSLYKPPFGGRVRFAWSRPSNLGEMDPKFPARDTADRAVRFGNLYMTDASGCADLGSYYGNGAAWPGSAYGEVGAIYTGPLSGYVTDDAREVPHQFVYRAQGCSIYT